MSMATATAGPEPGTGDRPAVRHLASGITLDPGQLVWQRERNSWSRQDLVDQIAQLYLDGHQDALPFWHRDGDPADGHRPVPGTGSLSRICARCGAPVSGGLTRDAIAKHESTGPNRRKPKPATLRAIVAALSEYGEPVRPGDLLPGAPERERSPEALEREARRERNRKLREFAKVVGRPELAWSPAGRARYTVELQRLYAEYEKHQAARAGTALAS